VWVTLPVGDPGRWAPEKEGRDEQTAYRLVRLVLVAERQSRPAWVCQAAQAIPLSDKTAEAGQVVAILDGQPTPTKRAQASMGDDLGRLSYPAELRKDAQGQPQGRNPARRNAHAPPPFTCHPAGGDRRPPPRPQPPARRETPPPRLRGRTPVSPDLGH